MIAGRAVARHLYIPNVDERSKQTMVTIEVSLPHPDGVTYTPIGSFESCAVKVVSKPSKKKQQPAKATDRS